MYIFNSTYLKTNYVFSWYIYHFLNYENKCIFFELRRLMLILFCYLKENRVDFSFLEYLFINAESALPNYLIYTVFKPKTNFKQTI